MDKRNWKLNKILWTVVALFLATAVYSQINLEGEYCRNFGDIIYGQTYYKFSADGKFTYHKWDDVVNEYGKGIYHLTKDTLYLHFDQYPKLPKKHYELFEKKVEDTTQIYSTVRLFDNYNNNQKIFSPYALYRNDSLLHSGRLTSYNSIQFVPQSGTQIKLSAFYEESNRFESMLVPCTIDIRNSTPKNYIVVIESSFNVHVPTSTVKYPCKYNPLFKSFRLTLGNFKTTFYKCE